MKRPRTPWSGRFRDVLGDMTIHADFNLIGRIVHWRQNKYTNILYNIIAIFTGGLNILASQSAIFIVIFVLSWNNISLSIVFLMLVLVATELIMFSALRINAIIGTIGLVAYYRDVIDGRFKVRSHNPGPLFEALGLHDLLRSLRVNAMTSKGGITDVGILKTLDGTYNFAPQRKGFGMPGGMSIGATESMLESSSVVFLAGAPSPTKASSCLQLFHEIGHTTKYSFRSRFRPFIHIFAVCLLVMYLLYANLLPQQSFFYWISLILFIPLLPWVFVICCYGLSGVKFVDEIIADRIAFELLRMSHLKADPADYYRNFIEVIEPKEKYRIIRTSAINAYLDIKGGRAGAIASLILLLPGFIQWLTGVSTIFMIAILGLGSVKLTADAVVKFYYLVLLLWVFSVFTKALSSWIAAYGVLKFNTDAFGAMMLRKYGKTYVSILLVCQNLSGIKRLDKRMIVSTFGGIGMQGTLLYFLPTIVIFLMEKLHL